MAILDDDTELKRVAGNVYEGRISPRWSVVGPNGGYLGSFILRAFLEETPMPDPLTMTVHYLARATPGPARVELEVLRTGRSHATLLARLIQGELICVAIATFGRQRPDAAQLVTATMPTLPPPDACDVSTSVPRPEMTIAQRFDRRIHPNGKPRFGGRGGDEPIAGGWIRMHDRDLDDLAVPLFMDAWPASIWAATGQSTGAPTVELTVHWRSKPHTAWHLLWFETPCLTGGYFVESGALWGEDGALVAESRQLARFVETGNDDP